ncbi:hypothetical protein CFC21_071523 [Triticum aestivum]|uniref:Bifunctional inhibitor/plant lipid transfer protein/seed storage helical domain-containing protein n=2 Tax=Triticum aestivum TaxID=4565 RepID=A0A9R1HGA1_WHEAT|nr:hypothetical protein CFC21_071523 [Triticum aestivum]
MAARARAVAAMSSSSSVLLAAAVALALLVASASAQSGCTSALIGLYPCMNYISGSGTAPTKSCCSQLASVVQSQLQCLCSALGGDSSSLGGITINKTRALELPNACNVQTPPASKCNGGKCSTVYHFTSYKSQELHCMYNNVVIASWVTDTRRLFCLQLVVAVLLVPVPTRRPPRP